MKALYTSEAIRRAVRSVFAKGAGRRVAVVAFVGAGAEAYLPRPKGIELYRWPSPTGTNAKALRVLQALGVDIFFVRRLHMKVYWSTRLGVVVTSANLSTNAYGQGDLKEFGVHLPSSAVNIRRIIGSLRAVSATSEAIRALEREQRNVPRRREDFEQPPTFADWYDARSRGLRWLMIAFDGYVPASAALRKVARQDRSDGKIVDWINCARGEIHENDHLLCINRTSGRTMNAEWMFVHRVVRMKPDDRAYERGYSYQAGQVYPRRSCPRSPFKIDARFRSALRRAAKTLDGKLADRYFDTRGRPPEGLLRVLRQLY
jgi:hypothetical protein